MKNLIITFIFLRIALLQGQSYDPPTDYLRNSTQGNNIKWEKVEGSPYQHQVFKEGQLKINDTVYDALLRYNIYEDEIEIKGKGNTISNVLKRAYIRVTIDGNQLGIHKYSSNSTLKQGYFLELSGNSVGKDVLFLKKLKRTFIEATEATSSYAKGSPPRILKGQDYYIKLPGKPAVLVKLNKKNIIAALETEGESEKIKAYFANNKHKLKKENEVMDFINFYNAN